jgi:hypothetical protein
MTSVRRSPARVIGRAAAVALLASACDFGEVTQVERLGGGTADVTITLRADSLADAAAILGWGAVIPDIDITLAPVDSLLAEPRTARTDAAGVVRFEAVEAGGYRISFRRPFSPGEIERVHETGIIGVVDAIEVGVRGPTAEYDLAPVPMRRSGLVISEWYFNPYQPPGQPSYRTGGFIELYNNSDTTIYLDGKIIGSAWAAASTGIPCNLTDPFRNDPAGVWANEMQQFPGSGRDYPLPPGRTVVVATQAIDHTEFVDDMLDLSGADFQFSGTANPDNPSVPNMIELSTAINLLGHGILFHQTSLVPFVAEPVDLDALPRDQFMGTGSTILRFPAEQVVEVTSFGWNSPLVTWCGPFVHPSFDRRHGEFFSRDWLRSNNRRVAAVLPDGRKILQHSRTSELDFYLGPRTPGEIP